jgi:anti-anti-sigma factor
MDDIVLHVSKEYDVFTLKGDIKIATLLNASGVMSKHIEKNSHKDLVLDLSLVDYIDSSGLRMLINLQKRMATIKKCVYLLNPSEPAKRLLDETRTDKVFTIIDSLDRLDQQIAADIYHKYLPFTTAESDMKRLQLTCAVCGSGCVIGYLFDLNNFKWEWTNSNPFPTAYLPGTETQIDVLGHLPVVCSECYMSSNNIGDFNVVDGETVVIKSNLNDVNKALLSKTIKKRKKMMQNDPISDSFFEYPRDKNACYKAYALAEFCTRNISVSKGSSNPYLVGFLNYLCLRYAKTEEKSDLINNCRTWFTQALNQVDKLNELEIAVSYFAILLSDINLGKFDEGYKAISNIKEHSEKLPQSQSARTFTNPAFWYQQAQNIWQTEMDAKSRILQ